MVELDSPRSGIQLGRARCQLIRVGFIHLVDLLGALQTCNDGFSFMLGLGDMRLRLDTSSNATAM